jgi:hypothetical protein
VFVVFEVVVSVDGMLEVLDEWIVEVVEVW